ncbi:P-loop containing nucleoside triphosphate hydrolase protein [Thozetella sp. PMI_491]|nr:P-loop containing nucleoside triphosphate hydrolase protein [Thozetella sp. PMI_491]
MFARPLIACVVLALIELVTVILQPFLLQRLLADPKPSIIAAAFVAGILHALCANHIMLIMRLVGVRLRSAMTALVCDKGLDQPAVAGVGGSAPPSSDPAVIIEVDLVHIFTLVENLNGMWFIPLQLVVSLMAAMYILGWQSVLAACGAALLIVPPLMVCLGFLSRRLRQVLVAKDARVSLIKEVLARIKHIKLYGWQAVFEDKIDEARASEMRAWGHVVVTNVCISFLSHLVPIVLVATSFATRVALGHDLSSGVVFPSLILFNIVNRALIMLPGLFMMYQGGIISYGRVREYLMAPGNREEFHDTPTPEADESYEIGMSQASYNIPGISNKTILHNCTLDAPRGKLTVIVGAVGSGKTTLLRAMVGDIQPQQGLVQASRQAAYSPQKPFLINGTIRENILFGLPFDPVWYGQVIAAVCLGPDFARLPDGDSTLLEGDGRSLSGGQQSKVALSRAVYSRKPLVVLDEPLASIDVETQRKLIEDVLGPSGLLHGRTRVITTSNKALIQAANSVYVIADGTITPNILPLEVPESHGPLENPQSLAILALGSTAGIEYPEPDVESLLQHKINPSVGDNLADISAESVKLRTYMAYLGAAKFWGWPLAIAIAIVNMFISVRAVYYLQQTSDEFERTGHSSKLINYAMFGVLGSLLAATFMLTAFFACIIPASRAVHSFLTSGILKSKFSFFDTTPAGAILNRFTNDINKIDSTVALGFSALSLFGPIVIMTVFVVIFNAIASLLYLGPLIIFYLSLQYYYRRACRQLRRLDSSARGPILNTSGEMSNGAPVILAYDQADFFKERARHFVDQHQRVWLPFVCINIWLQLRLQVIGSVIQALTASLLISLKTSPSTLGFVMSYVLQATGILGGFVQLIASLEADLTSWERIQRYAMNPPEEESDSGLSSLPSPPSPPLSPTWPADPTITFEKFSASYRPGGPLCLRDLNLTIAGGERIGIVGRTGAGKSSLVLALMQALDKEAVLAGGRITIDGRDILRGVSITELRRNISVIPQGPVAFTGCLRENLDPVGDKADEELRDAAARCRLAEMLRIDAGDDLLEYRISDGGSLLSAGQTQLLGIARAIIARRKIVVIDEATAAVDQETADLIQDVMRQAFQGSTIITIAHQMLSVIDHDRIMVMDGGSVVEFEKPEVLLRDSNSIFSRLAKESGLEPTT